LKRSFGYGAYSPMAGNPHEIIRSLILQKTTLPISRKNYSFRILKTAEIPVPKKALKTKYDKMEVSNQEI